MVATEWSQDEILLDMLSRIKGKAEIVNGRIIHFMPAGENQDTRPVAFICRWLFTKK